MQRAREGRSDDGVPYWARARFTSGGLLSEYAPQISEEATRKPQSGKAGFTERQQEGIFMFATLNKRTSSIGVGARGS